jgi:hypothetical protein
MDARLSINAQVKGSFLQFGAHRMTQTLQINLALAETFSGTEYAAAARALIALTAFVRLPRYVAAQVARGWFHEVLLQLLHSECDVILTPATAETAPLVPSNLHTGNAHDRDVLRSSALASSRLTCMQASSISPPQRCFRSFPELV